MILLAMVDVMRMKIDRRVAVHAVSRMIGRSGDDVAKKRVDVAVSRSVAK
jgi:hypothetical protein